MFHFEEKLKDLKIEFNSQVYVIKYKNEIASIWIKDDKPMLYRLTWNDDTAGGRAKNSHHIVVGEGNLKRDVWHFSTPDGPLPTLRCGYTVHNGANTWSSTPHPFELVPEKGFEEVFLYLLSSNTTTPPVTPQAIQCGVGLWQDHDGINDIWRVKDRDISAIPMGYHPVVGEPGVHVSYIWAYLAKKGGWEKI